MSLKNYSIEQLLSEVCRRCGDNVKINDEPVIVDNEKELTTFEEACQAFPKLIDGDINLLDTLAELLADIRHDHDARIKKFHLFNDSLTLTVLFTYDYRDFPHGDYPSITVHSIAHHVNTGKWHDVKFAEMVFNDIDDYFDSCLANKMPEAMVTYEHFVETAMALSVAYDIDEIDATERLSKFLEIDKS